MSTKSFSIKKFLLEADQHLMEEYNHLVSVFFYDALDILPEKIEIVSLIDRKVSILYPNEHDIPKGVQYLNRLKRLIDESNQGCFECPLTQQCKDFYKDNDFH